MTISIAQQVAYDVNILIHKLNVQAKEMGMKFSVDNFGVKFEDSTKTFSYTFMELILRGFIAWSTGKEMPVDIEDKWGLLRGSYSMRELVQELNEDFLPKFLKDNPESIRAAAGWKLADEESNRMSHSTSIFVIYKNGASYERVFQDAPLMLLHKIGCLELEAIPRNSLCADYPVTMSIDFTQQAKDHFFQMQTDAMTHLRSSYFGVTNA